MRKDFTIPQLRAFGGEYIERYGSYSVRFYLYQLDERMYIHVTDLFANDDLLSPDTRLQKFTSTKTARKAAQKDLRKFCEDVLKGLADV